MILQVIEPKGLIDNTKPRCSSVIPNIATMETSIIRCLTQESIETIVVMLNTNQFAVVEFCKSCAEDYRRIHGEKETYPEFSKSNNNLPRITQYEKLRQWWNK